MQIREMQAAAEHRGFTADIFTDPGWSGSKESRPELDRMLDLCRRGKYGVVMVYRFDRFARTLKQLLAALEEFDSLGVKFISLHENIDTTGPTGRLMFQIVAAFAEFERNLIRERVRSGIANARAKGKTLGRPSVVTDAQRARIGQLRDAGKPWRAIAGELDLRLATVLRCAPGRSKNPFQDA